MGQAEKVVASHNLVVQGYDRIKEGSDLQAIYSPRTR